MARRVSRAIFLIVLLMIMTAIFLFSSQTSSESGELSRNVTQGIAQAASPSFRELDAARQQDYVDVAYLRMRKYAHFFLFCALGAAAMCVLESGNNRDRSRLQKMRLAVLFSFLYACTDEFHQFFVPGRSAQLQDVALDTAGAVCGSLFVLLALLAAGRLAKGNGGRGGRCDQTSLES